MTWITKKDAEGNAISPGDVCIRARRHTGCEYCIYVDSVWGGKVSRGEFGRFLTSKGLTSIKYSNILLAFDPMSKRRPELGVNELIRRFYEQGKN